MVAVRGEQRNKRQGFMKSEFRLKKGGGELCLDFNLEIWKLKWNNLGRKLIESGYPAYDPAAALCSSKKQWKQWPAHLIGSEAS